MADSRETELRPERGRSVSEQGQREQADDPESGIFPAAVLVGEEPAGLAVNHHDRAEHERHQGQRYPASFDAKDEQDAADDFRGHRQVRKLTREAERFEILRGARRRKDFDLHPGVSEKHHTQRDTQKQGRNRCLFEARHRKSSSGVEPRLSYAYPSELCETLRAAIDHPKLSMPPLTSPPPARLPP